MYEEALKLATKAHKGQKRWNGADYINHPRRVAERFPDDVRRTVGVLHDVLEDTDITEEELREKFGRKVSSAVVALTKRSGEDYMSFVRRASKHYIARDVKIADIEDNMTDVPEDNEELVERAMNLRGNKYIPALAYLRGL